MNDFDLVEQQLIVRSLETEEKVFTTWSTYCTLYDTGRISRLTLEEMRPVVFKRFAQLRSLREMVDGSTK